MHILKLSKNGVLIVLFPIVFAVILRVFFIDVYKIPSSSMVPTLLPGDFIIVSKMSYGTRYYNATYNDALEDVKEWGNCILKQYNNIPLFCLSMSSGNTLMENLLTQDPNGIRAAASLFGIPVETNNESFSVPSLYILGENDPKVAFLNRYSALQKEKEYNSSISIISYSDEGHWFREKDILQDAVDKIIKYFCRYSN